MSLVTCCPKCSSEYDVTADQLKLRDGLVRCGHCSHVFDGFACLKDSLPTLTRKVPSQAPDEAPTGPTPVLKTQAPPATSRAESKPELKPQPKPDNASAVSQDPLKAPRTPAVAPASDGPFVPSVDRIRLQPAQNSDARQEPEWVIGRSVASPNPQEPSFGELLQTQDMPVTDDREPVLGAIDAFKSNLSRAQTQQPAVQVMGEARVRGDDPSAFGRTVPEFLEDEEPPPEGVNLLWIVGSVVLVVVLLVQAMVVYRNDIAAAAPGMRGFLVQLCKPLSCDVSYVRQINRIFIVGSSLQQATTAESPANQRAYTLRLTLQNRWSYQQPWPSLMVTLTDSSGTAVIRKAIRPSQYLSPELLAGPMAARQEVSLEIPLLVDGLNISGYELDRFFP
jgi:predicted Zn finger-like uncharacterized protein